MHVDYNINHFATLSLSHHHHHHFNVHFIVGFYISSNRSSEILTHLYKSLVRLPFEYVQHSGMIICKGKVQKNYLGIEEYEALEILSLKERRNRSDMVEMLRVLKRLSVTPVETFFEWEW